MKHTSIIVIVSGAQHFVLTELIISAMQLCRTRIMKSAGNDDQISISYKIHQAMRFIDAPRPVPGQITTQWLWLTDTCERITCSCSNQQIQVLECFLILRMPVLIRLPRPVQSEWLARLINGKQFVILCLPSFILFNCPGQSCGIRGITG